MVRCLREKPVPTLHCNICRVHLCEICLGKHIVYKSENLKLVPFEKRGPTPNLHKFPEHLGKQIQLNCKQCQIFICMQFFSNKHHYHDVEDFFKCFKRKQKVLQRDLQELQKYIFPKYHEIACTIQIEEKTDLNQNSKKLTEALNKQGKIWHREINNVTKKMKQEIHEMEYKYLTVLNNIEDDIKHRISEITKISVDLNKMLVSKDICLIAKYKSRNAWYRIFPPKLKVSLPKFSPQKINSMVIYQKFGFLPELSIK